MKIIGEFQTTISKALGEIDLGWRSYDGLIICGTHSPEKFDIDRAMEEIYVARESGKPFLGICFGHQLAAIEYARNVLGIVEATSQEFGNQGKFVVAKLPQLKVGQHDGETYWNNYEVIPEILSVWKKNDNFITTQAHPEYQSSIDKPHPLLLKFLYHAKNHAAKK
jgi:CTP synthase (UTP-ammonia lyase)